MDITIKELVKGTSYIVEFDSRSYFDDSIKEGDKYVYHRIGDITRKFLHKRYTIVVKSVSELTTEELMEIFQHSVSETAHIERIKKSITNLLV